MVGELKSLTSGDWLRFGIALVTMLAGFFAFSRELINDVHAEIEAVEMQANDANSMLRSDLLKLQGRLTSLEARLSSHEVRPAHGDVRPRLTGAERDIESLRRDLDRLLGRN